MTDRNVERESASNVLDQGTEKKDPLLEEIEEVSAWPDRLILRQYGAHLRRIGDEKGLEGINKLLTMIDYWVPAGIRAIAKNRLAEKEKQKVR